MKAILEFDLSDPDQKEDHRMMLKASDYYSALEEIKDLFRKMEKYNVGLGGKKINGKYNSFIIELQKDINIIINDNLNEE